MYRDKVVLRYEWVSFLICPDQDWLWSLYQYNLNIKVKLLNVECKICNILLQILNTTDHLFLPRLTVTSRAHRSRFLTIRCCNGVVRIVLPWDHGKAFMLWENLLVTELNLRGEAHAQKDEFWLPAISISHPLSPGSFSEISIESWEAELPRRNFTHPWVRRNSPQLVGLWHFGPIVTMKLKPGA